MGAPSITDVSSTSSSVSLRITNSDAAAASFLVEFNRASDFSSDDTLIYNAGSEAGGGSSPHTISGLPSGTPWHIRVTNLTSGGSNRALIATTTVAPNTTYTGFSIEKAGLVVPAAIVKMAPNFTTGGTVAGYPVSNLLVDSPAATARLSGPLVGWVDFETSGEPIDTIALLGSLCSDDATWVVQSFTDENRAVAALRYDTGVLTFRCSPTLSARRVYHALNIAPVPRTERYWRVQIRAAAPQIILRHLIVGLMRQSVNASRGWSHGMNDLGTAGLTRFGDPDIVPGWRGKTVDFEMSWLTEREYQTKWADLPQLVGRTKPVLVIPNSKRNVWLNDRIGYGTITDYRAENVQSSRHSVSIAVNSIY